MALLILGLIIAAFIMLPLYAGFWPVGLVVAGIASLIGVVYVYSNNDKGEEGLVEIVMGLIAIGCIWFGIALAGVIRWIT